MPEYSIPTSQTFICKNRPNPVRLTPRCTPSCRLRSLSCSCPRCWTCSRKVAAVSLDEVDTDQFFSFYQFFCSCPRLLLELIWPGKLQQHFFKNHHFQIRNRNIFVICRQRGLSYVIDFLSFKVTILRANKLILHAQNESSTGLHLKIKHRY